MNNFNWDFQDLFNEFPAGFLKNTPWAVKLLQLVKDETTHLHPWGSTSFWFTNVDLWVGFFKYFWTFVQDSPGETWTTLGFALQKCFPSHFLLEKSPPKVLLPVGFGGWMWGAPLRFVQVMSSKEMALVVLWCWPGLWWWAHGEVKVPLLITQLFDSLHLSGHHQL